MTIKQRRMTPQEISELMEKIRVRMEKLAKKEKKPAKPGENV